MLKSMTGYGRCSDCIDGFEISFEIRSVNNRYLDTNIRLPRIYGYLEEKIKKAIQKKAARGKVDAFLTVERPAGEATEIVLDEALAAQYVGALRKIAENHGLRDDISVSSVARFSDIFSKKVKEDDADAVWNAVEPVVEKALDAFLTMREKEGENLFRDLDARLDRMEQILESIKAHSAEALGEYRDKLEARLQEYLADTQIDQSRLLTEVGIIADKIDTGEEITRLASHIDQFRKLIRQDTPSGRTMDFLTQELNREVNTIGSKCSQLAVTSLVIDAKNEIERIREQIQNIE
ncbi:MAG: YicC family protein [Ruminococcaceae bacterium]|nr:YicC family protein [Oscillospiraceae bacterium]